MRNSSINGIGVLGTLILFLFSGIWGSFAHIGGVPDLVLQLEIREKTILGQITAPVQIIRELTQIEIPDPPGFDASGSEKLIADFQSALATKDLIRLDGIQVTPIIASFSFSVITNFLGPNDPGLVVGDFFFSLPSKGEPNQISIKLEFSNTGGMEVINPPGVPTQRLMQAMAVISAEGQRRFAALSASEPEYIWHSEKTIPHPDFLKVSSQVSSAKIPLGTWLLLQGCIVFAALWAVPARWLAKPKKVVCFLISWTIPFLWLQLAAFVPCPFVVKPSIPALAEALEIFSTLHRNIYRAFDYSKEGEIYDTLARSVDGRLLRWVYNEIHQSLILRSEGGAVCQIQAVEILQSFLPDTKNEDLEEGMFRIVCRWKVRGVVEHWGHVHSRTNIYEAEFAVAPVQGAWKIIDVQILDQQRKLVSEESATKPPADAPATGPARPLPRAGALASVSGGRPSAGPLPVDNLSLTPADWNRSEFIKLTGMANSGDTEAQLRVGEIYFKGLYGVPCDKPEGIRWLRKSAEQDNPQAQYRLGKILFAGIDLPKDLSKAMALFRKAAEKNDPDAQFSLGVMFDEGEGTSPDPIQAVAWYRKAAGQGQSMAEYNLGMMYFEGKGIPKDPIEAAKWFKMAAEKGEVRAQFSLGVMYLGGSGLKLDYPEAFRWFSKAAELGDPDAGFNLGIMYEKGLGCPKDLDQSRRWLEGAAAAGSSDARDYLVSRQPGSGK